MISVNKCIH